METWYVLISQYGYIAIIAILTLGIIGLPIPDEVLLTYLGFLTSIGRLHFSLLVLAALFGAICGITISYFLGKKLGEPFIRKFGPKLFIKEKTIDRTNRLFYKYGSLVLFVCYFIPGIRHVAAYVAGITKYPFKLFALYAYSGALVWVMVFLVIGNRLGDHWELIDHYFKEYIWAITCSVGVAFAVVIIYLLLKRWHKNT